jgi:hypothetical protein
MRPGLAIVRVLLWPYFRVTGWRYHPQSGLWLDRAWDEIPAYVVVSGMLMYVVAIAGALVIVLNVVFP